MKVFQRCHFYTNAIHVAAIALHQLSAAEFVLKPLQGQASEEKKRMSAFVLFIWDKAQMFT